ncbi:hypothetical protein D0Z08_20635 [Nocardioides immobilis]|uniref:Leucine-binding protein domain-containing protein n=1 Tax=Nocardioides immobilis TaxID=2049295 RepID=A0A417XX98_9ACTN|nr:branched-chain amino acid ABC transporter substrate-binding protein [Nocardioides immobilis]RHW25108.1 hypothetical protein D0Z08_20635 [Nocardioides immobilis]
MSRLVAGVIGVVAASVLAACGSDDAAEPPEDRGELTIYSSLPLQGDSKPQSEDIVRAFELALEEREGRAGGYDINYVSLDDADPELGFWTPELAAANAWQAGKDPTTIAYLGDFNSGASAASVPILNNAGILQVSPSNTYLGLTRAAEPEEPDVYYPSGERTYARVVPADHVQAGALVAEMTTRECTDVFIVHHDEIYGLGLADAVEASAAEAGIDILGRTSLGARTSDEVVAAEPDCLLFAGLTQDGATEIANDLGQALPELRMFFPDGCAELAFAEAIDEEIQVRVFITNPTLDKLSYPEAGQRFYRDFSELHGRDPEPFAIYGYEAMSLVLDAIDRAGDAAAADESGRAAVVDAVFATTDRESVLGTYSIDAYGDTTLTAYGGYAVVEGEIAFDHVIEPAVIEPTTGPEITDPPDPPTESAVPEESEEPGAVSPIEGTWKGGEVTEDMVAAEWGRRAARFVFEANDAEEHLASTLELHGSTWQALVSVDGGPEQPAQGGTFSVEGDRIFFEETGYASYEYRYSLEGETLRITLVRSDAEPAAPGIPDDVFQYAHIEAAPFEKVG